MLVYQRVYSNPGIFRGSSEPVPNFEALMESKAWIPMMKPSSISTWKLRSKGSRWRTIFCIFVGDLVQNIGISNCILFRATGLLFLRGFKLMEIKNKLDLR